MLSIICSNPCVASVDPFTRIQVIRVAQNALFYSLGLPLLSSVIMQKIIFINSFICMMMS